MFPAELSFGVFDSAIQRQVVPAPIICFWQVKVLPGKVFFTAIDGGSVLDGGGVRFLFRGTVAPDSLGEDVDPRPGDVVRLSEYALREVNGKGEVVLYVFKMATLRRIDSLARDIPRDRLQGYPFATAPADLARRAQTRQPSGGVMSGDRAAPTSRGLYPSLDQSHDTEAPRSTDASPRPVLQGSDSYGPIRRPQSDAATGRPDPGVASARASPYPSQYRQTGPIARRIDGQFISIKDLTSFLGRWIVKGRFINKGEPRTYTNARGEGRLWTCELMDSADARGTIRCTFFNKAVDKFFPLIRENEVYTVTKGSLRASNRKFNSGAHEFEMQLGEDAEIQWYAQDDPTIPQKSVPMVIPIAELASVPKKSAVSICGVLLHIADPQEIITRSTGQPRMKQEILVADASNSTINVTLWGTKMKLIEDLNPMERPILLIENATVDEFNGRRLSSAAHTTVLVNPSTPDAVRIGQWFQMEGRHREGQFAALSTAGWGDGEKERASISELKSRAGEASEKDLEDKGVWFTCRATLRNIERERQFYWVACPTCKKKVSAAADASIDDTYGTSSGTGPNGEIDVSFCPNCQKEVERPTKQYLLNLEIGDPTGSLKCSCMGEAGKALMGGVDADVIANTKGRECDMTLVKRFSDYFSDRLSKEYLFTIQAKSERYRDEQRLRYRIFGAVPLNVASGTATNENLLAKEIRIALDTIFEKIPRVTVH